jgi:hypothetical protein
MQRRAHTSATAGTHQGLTKRQQHVAGIEPAYFTCQLVHAARAQRSAARQMPAHHARETLAAGCTGWRQPTPEGAWVDRQGTCAGGRRNGQGTIKAAEKVGSLQCVDAQIQQHYMQPDTLR